MFKISKVLFLVLSLFLFSTASSAYFGSNTEYQSPDLYGNGQSCCFRGAMTGGPNCLGDEALLLGSLPVKDVGRYYARVSVNSGSLTLTSLRNRSTAGVFGSATVVTPRARRGLVGLELALGYVFSKDTRLELEYLVTRNLTYTASPLFSFPGGGGPTGSLTATVNNNTFLINGYYEFVFGGYDRFKPFIMLGIGPSFMSVQSTATFPTGTFQRTRTYVSFAAGGGLGFRFSIFSRWYVTASLRYIYLGNVNIDLPTTPFGTRLQGTYSYTPVSLGLMYIF